MDGSNYGIVAKKGNRAAVMLIGLSALGRAIHRGVGLELMGKIHQITTTGVQES